MRLLKNLRNWPKKRGNVYNDNASAVEDAPTCTDESQPSASSWRNTLRQLYRSGSRANLTAVMPGSAKKKRRHQQKQAGERIKLLPLRQQQETRLRQATRSNSKTHGGGATTMEAHQSQGTPATSELDLFQTLMSSNAAPRSNSAGRGSGGGGGVGGGGSIAGAIGLSSGNNRGGAGGGGVHAWHQDDPSFMPTAYPLMRADPRMIAEAKWGTLNLQAAAALIEAPLKRFDSVRRGRPPFRLGPRQPEDMSDMDDALSSTASSCRSRSALDMQPQKYAYISQDGKLVEREVQRWPWQRRPDLTLRYKLSEPYASNYGKRSVRRARSLAMRPILPWTRRVYQKPIYLVPLAVVNENKRRLMARHALKDQLEPPPTHRLPMKVSMQESEQCKLYRQHLAAKYIKETKERVAYVERLRRKDAVPQEPEDEEGPHSE